MARSKGLLIPLFVGIVCAANSANGASLVIDAFNDADPGPNQEASQTGVGTNSSVDTGLSNVIAPGDRELFIELTADPGSLGGETAVATALERLSVSLADAVDGYGESRYLGLVSADLLLGETPANAFFQAQVVSADQDVTLTATITDESSNSATFTSAPLVAGSFVNQALGSFVNAGAVDFTDVDSIVLRLSGPTAFDASITLLEITTTPGPGGSVPEPSSALLVLVGMGLLFSRRRRRST